MKLNLQFVRTVKKKHFLHKLAFTVISSFLLLGISQNALALTKPTLQSPTNNSQITTPSVTFSWSHPYNDQYEVKIKTSGGTLKYASGKTSSKSKTVNLSSIPLTSGSTYIWYVVVYASGQEISSADSLFTYKFAGRVDLSGGINVSLSSVTIGQNFTVSFSLKEFQGGPKTFEYVQLWIQNSAGGDLYMAQQWSNETFAANQQKSYSATTNLNPAQGRSAGAYRAIVRGKVAGESAFNFGVVSGSGAVTPKAFTAVAAASPTPPSPSQPPPSSPAPAVQPKPIVSGRVDLSAGLNVPSSVTIGQNFTVSFNLKEFQGGPKTFEYVQLWIQNSAGGDLYMAQQWSNETFAANQQKSYSATTSLNPAQGRSPGTYRAIARGKVAGESPFNFGVVGGTGAVTPKTFTAVAAASPPPPSPSQPQPAVPAPAERQKPIVTRFDVETVGGTVTVTYTVTDLGGSGLKQVELWRSPNNKDWEKIATKTLPLLSKDPASGSFPADTPPSAGTYYYGIHVVDQAGNWNSEGGPKTATIGLPTQSHGSVSSSKPVFPLPDNFKLNNYKGRGLCDYKNEDGWQHTGVDIPTNNAEPPVKAVCKGIIIYNTTNRTNGRGYTTNYGKYWNAFLIIKHDCDEDGVFESVGVYGHLISNKSGKVNKGEILGSIRKAYNKNDKLVPSNNHLHFGYNNNVNRPPQNHWGYFGNTCEDVKKAGWYDPIQKYNLY